MPEVCDGARADDARRPGRNPGRARTPIVEARGTVLTGWEGGLRIGVTTRPLLRPQLSGSRQTTRKYPRPAKVESVATEQEPHAGMAGALFVGGSSVRRLPHPHPHQVERAVSPSSRCAPSGRTDAAEDRTVPGTIMARPGVDGQAGTERSPGVSGGRKPSHHAMPIGLVLANFGGPGADRRRVSRRDREA
jgi:hypothetical protein